MSFRLLFVGDVVGPAGCAAVLDLVPRLREELRLVAPSILLLVGGMAHRFAYGEGARLDDLVGRELTWEEAPGASVLCLPHPSGASTWLNDPARVELWRRAIAILRDRWAEVDPA